MLGQALTMQSTKRRRVSQTLDPRAAYGSQSGGQVHSAQHSSAPYIRDASAANPAATTTPFYSSSFVGSGQNLPDDGVEALRSTPHVGGQQQWDAAAPYTRYPEAGQPYYAAYAQQSTDPSTYNSPWPPQSRSESFQNQGNYGPSNEMPYLGANGTGVLNATTRYNTTDNSLEGFDPDVEMETDYGYGALRETQAVSALASGGSPTITDDASMQLKNQSLPILDNLATQVIQTIAKISLPQIQDILSGEEFEEGQAYHTLKSLFEQTRKVYSRESSFIDAIAIQMFQPSQQEVIRKANIATFISSILGAHDVSFFHLNEFFMETFVPLGHRLLKWQGAIYLDLKTQAYISALINSDGTPSAMLDELFPADLDAQILTRHPDAPSMSPSEQDFIDRCRARKSYLLAEGNAATALKELPKKYQWTEFVREFACCVSKNVDSIMNSSSKTPGVTLDRRNTFSVLDNSQDLPTRTLPSSQAATSAANTITAAPTTSTMTSGTVRQPWTKPEEDALLAGLDRVNGPHWSQILALYGRGGSISEVLKDRNQVQLKDKARNLKLWYLKMGQEVPVALQGVTGELRKRGGKGARAAALADAAAEQGGDSGVDGSSALAKGGAVRRGKTKKGS